MKCRRPEKNCFGLRAGGECGCLTDTQFDRPCPFYKKDNVDYSRTFLFPDFPGRKWKRVRGYPGEYYVSEWGEIKNNKNHILKPDVRSKKKPFVNLLSDNNSPRRTYIADVVADAFLPGSGPYEHIDGNNYNCAVYNLRRTIKTE